MKLTILNKHTDGVHPDLIRLREHAITFVKLHGKSKYPKSTAHGLPTNKHKQSTEFAYHGLTPLKPLNKR